MHQLKLGYIHGHWSGQWEPLIADISYPVLTDREAEAEAARHTFDFTLDDYLGTEAVTSDSDGTKDSGS